MTQECLLNLWQAKYFLISEVSVSQALELQALGSRLQVLNHSF